MALKDWIEDEAGDLLIKDGDFAIDEADEIHVQNILEASKGNYRQFPLIGVGLHDYINISMTTSGRQRMSKEIQKHLEYDGFKVRSVGVSQDFKIDIDCERI